MYENHGYSPLISKIRVHNPNKKGSSQANRNYVTYIATREGVSLESVNGINDLLHEEGMLEKELRENILHQEAGNKEYVEYMAKRPRSQGLFGNIDTSDLKAVSSEIASLTKSGRIIYRGIISLSEKDGEEKGFRNVNEWYNYLKKTMPSVAKELGISSFNHTWVAAFHAEEKHPHVHYMLWENEDRVRSPYIHKATQQKIRIYLQNEMFDDEYSRAVDNVVRQEHNELNAARNRERKVMLDGVKSLMQDVSYVPGVEYERLLSRVTNEYLERIAKEAQSLINALPGQGSFKYKYMSGEAKAQLEKMIDIVLEKDDIKNAYDTYLQYVVDDGKLHGQTKSQIDAHIGKIIRTELRPRIANKILDEIKKAVIPERNESNQQYKIQERENENNNGINDILLRKVENGIMPVQVEDKVPTVPETFEVSELPESEILEVIDEQFMTNYFVEWNQEYKYAMQLIYGENPKFEKAFELMEKEAMHGNALAINEMGKLIEHQLIDVPAFKAHEYYKEAITAFTNIYERALNNDVSLIPKDASEEVIRKFNFEWVQSYAAYRIGKLYNFTKDIDEKQLEKAAEWYFKAGSNKYAQYSLAKLYLNGDIYVSENKDILENKKAAIELLESSAKQINPYADYLLATLYEKETIEKAEPYYVSAFKGFLSMAENTKDDSLLYRIGSMYLFGKGTVQDKEAGTVYIKKSADLGYENAKMKLASIYLDENKAELSKLAFDILDEMAENNHPMAQYKLGCIYADEERSEYNLQKAINHLQKSAEQGNECAQYKLGCIYADKERPEYNLQKAINYLEKAVVQNNEYAQYQLGCIYSNQELPVYDINRAIQHFNTLAQQGNCFSQCRLGCIYYFGKGGPEDKELGKYWLQRAAEQGDEFADKVLNNNMIGIDFSYCLLKGVLSSLEAYNRQAAYVNNEYLMRTNSKQAAIEKNMHRDNEMDIEF